MSDDINCFMKDLRVRTRLTRFSYQLTILLLNNRLKKKQHTQTQSYHSKNDTLNKDQKHVTLLLQFRTSVFMIKH